MFFCRCLAVFRRVSKRCGLGERLSPLLLSKPDMRLSVESTGGAVPLRAPFPPAALQTGRDSFPSSSFPPVLLPLEQVLHLLNYSMACTKPYKIRLSCRGNVVVWC